jgi:hypothetical protein
MQSMRYASWRDPDSGVEYRFEFASPHAGEGTTVHIFAGGAHVGKTILLGEEEAHYEGAVTPAGGALSDREARELLGRSRQR